MSTRRMAYWWFRFVISGRFLETFLNLRRAQDSSKPAANEDCMSVKRETKPLSAPLRQP